ncbi:helix-turn-helix domain-containing protein [Xanthomonas citri]|uniref:helix-turn-helix domain-containing protein n=1 Tax=Xanthomonas citri TaxID=346 RepID=UPI00052E2AD0|nr:helix-turn-helix transcriptional regulator [Xanthomonas citri]CEH40221.1 putative transcriptional regulator [Xanthomonas citri pv. citri]
MFGEALRLVRAFHDVSQIDLANDLGISRSYLSEIESGKKVPSLDLLQKYSAHFNIPLSSLVLFSEQAGESKRDLDVKKMLGNKAIAILQWIESKAA